MVVIDTDDMNVTDLFVMRNTLSLLAAHGTTFRNSYVSYPLCCPSRATFLTGQYAHNHHVLTDQRYGDLDNTNTLAVWLRRAKYRTAMVGKYLNGYGVDPDPREIPPGWTQWYALTGGTEQHRYGFKLNENGKVRHYSRKPSNYIDYVLDSKVNGAAQEVGDQPEAVLPLLQPEQPARRVRHAGLVDARSRAGPSVPRRVRATSPRRTPPNFDEAERLRQAGGRSGTYPALSDAELADIDRRYRGRLESLLSVDDEVKRIVRPGPQVRRQAEDLLHLHLRQRPEMGAHRIEFKDYLYEEAERVPLIIRGPGFPQDTTRDQLVANIDLAPDDHGAHRCTPGTGHGRDPPAAAGQGPGGRRRTATLLIESLRHRRPSASGRGRGRTTSGTTATRSSTTSTTTPTSSPTCSTTHPGRSSRHRRNSRSQASSPQGWRS